MKSSKIFFLIVAFLLATLMVTLSACDTSDDPSAQETILTKLKSKTWTMKSVIVDGQDKSQDFNSMTISFSNNTLTTANGGVIWGSSGDTWQFVDKKAKAILRGDGLEIQLVTVSKSSLVVTLSWAENTFGPGRANSIEGAYTFSFE